MRSDLCFLCLFCGNPFRCHRPYIHRLQPERAQEDDVELLKAIAAKDEAALAQLYDRYRVILFGLLMRILNNREEAEDVLRKCFCRFGAKRKTSTKIAGARSRGW